MTGHEAICWHADGAVRHDDCVGRTAGYVLWHYGRCRSGSRWFWAAERFPYDDDKFALHGRAETETEAIAAAREAIRRRVGTDCAVAVRRDGTAYRALQKVNAAQRRSRPSRPGANRARATEFLYEPWSHYDDMDGYTRGISRVQIVKKTARRIYFNQTTRTDQYQGLVTLGYIDRQDFESDTRCHTRCPLHQPGLPCLEHLASSPHCPHGNAVDTCWHGEPPGAGRLRSIFGHGIVYASREAAEADLEMRVTGWAGGREAAEELLRQLRREMADAHPDRGGTSDGFIAARRRYEHALKATR